MIAKFTFDSVTWRVYLCDFRRRRKRSIDTMKITSPEKFKKTYADIVRYQEEAQSLETVTPGVNKYTTTGCTKRPIQKSETDNAKINRENTFRYCFVLYNPYIKNPFRIIVIGIKSAKQMMSDSR